jgi:hypothetical protein
MVRLAGLVLSVAYATFIIWLYAAQPQTVAEVTGSVASGVGAYQVDPQSSADGMAFFYRDAFPEARAAFERADPAHRDARTQFYIAYSGGVSITTTRCSGGGLRPSTGRSPSRRITAWWSMTLHSECTPRTN